MEKIVEVLISKRLFILSCYDVDGTCRYVKCINKQTGQTVFIQVSELNIQTPETFHKTAIKRSSNYVVEKCSTLPAVSLEGADLYDLIYLDPKQNQYKLIYEQIIRIGHCFRKISPRPIIQFKGVMCHLCKDGSLCWFEMETADDNIKYNMVISYEELGLISSLSAAEAQLFKILQCARDQQVSQILKTKLLDKIDARAKEAARQMRAKISSKQTLINQSLLLAEKEKTLANQRVLLSKLSYKTAQDTLASRDNNKQTDETRTEVLKIIQAIEVVNNEINNLIFENERDFYNLFKSLQPFM